MQIDQKPNSSINRVKQPIIIIGMHRSGTTMIASMLQELGLFIGNDLEENSESMFFIKHNNWLLKQCGASWDNPSSINYLYQNSTVLELSENYIRQQINGVSVHTYVGWKGYLIGVRPLVGMRQYEWGWKDPRNTYTLPFWLRLFPDARVIHIYRNGVAVAASLRARENKGLKLAKLIYMKKSFLGIYKFFSRNRGLVCSPRCLSLEGCFSLWEEYVETAIAMMENFAPNGLTLKYEDFIANPSAKLMELAQYCQLDLTQDQLNRLKLKVKEDRANSHEGDIELISFNNRIKHNVLMVKLGYA